MSDFKTASDGDEKIIEGYFVVFGKETELWPGAFEEVGKSAFDNSISNDIRALTNHDTNLVLGRTKAGTLTLRVDEYGLFGKIIINERDTDALNTYERVSRGDVDQCSFGFNIVKEETEWLDNDRVKWTITEADLHEVSVCTFPAYEATSVQARHDEVKQHKKRILEQKKNEIKRRLKNGAKTVND